MFGVDGWGIIYEFANHDCLENIMHSGISHKQKQNFEVEWAPKIKFDSSRDVDVQGCLRKCPLS